MSKYKNGNEMRARTRGKKGGSKEKSRNEAVFIWTFADPTDTQARNPNQAHRSVGLDIFDDVVASVGNELMPEIVSSEKVLACLPRELSFLKLLTLFQIS